jgi:ribosomal-protein-alanine N-acetyltransferase
MSEQEGILRPRSFSGDLWQVADLIEEVFADEIRSRDSRVVEEIRMLAQTASILKVIPGWERSLFGGMHGFVWDVDGRIVGTVTIQQSSRAPLVWQIANVAVAERMRGRGIAQKLVERALEEISHLGGTEAVLQVRSDNDVAIHIYQKFGFDAIGMESWWRGFPPRNEVEFPVLPGKLAPILQKHKRLVFGISRAVTERSLARSFRSDMQTLFPSAWQRVVEKSQRALGICKTWRLGAWNRNTMVGWLVVKRVSPRGKKHEMDVVVVPDCKEEWEPALAGHGVSLLIGAPHLPMEIHLINPSERTEEYLSGVGFEEVYSLTTMRKSL